MELQSVNFKQAIALKELGFPQDTHTSKVYLENTIPYDVIAKKCKLHKSQCSEGSLVKNGYCYTKYNINIYLCPTLELVVKWLREEKQIYLYVKRLFATSIIKNKNCYCFYYSTKIYDEILYVHEFDSYEQALSAGIDKAIKILKQQ